MTNVGEVVEKKNPHTLLVGMQTGAATMENCMEIPQKTKNRTTIRSSHPTTGYTMVSKCSFDLHFPDD